MTKKSRKRRQARSNSLARTAQHYEYDAVFDLLCVSLTEATTRSTPLMRALLRNDIRNLLGPDGKLKKEARVNAQAANGWSALHIVASNHHRGLGKFLPVLLESGADVNAPDGELRTALHHIFSWYENDTPVLHQVIELIARGADVNKADKNGITALMLALEITHENELENIVRELVRAGAQVNAADYSGITPVDYLFKNQRVYTSVGPLNVLVSAGLNVNAAGIYGATPIINAARIKSQPWFVEAVQVLIDAGANVNAVDNSKFGALAGAVLDLNQHSAGIVRALLKAGANARAFTVYGVSVFEYAQQQRGCTNTIVEFVIGGAADSLDDIHHRVDPRHERRNSVWVRLVEMARGHRKMRPAVGRDVRALAAAETSPLPGEDFLRAFLGDHAGLHVGQSSAGVSDEAGIREIAKAYVDANLVPYLKSLACSRSESEAGYGTVGTVSTVDTFNTINSWFNIDQSLTVDTDAIIELAVAPNDPGLSLSSWEKNAVFKSLVEIAREHREMRPVSENITRALAVAKTSSLPSGDFMRAFLDDFTADGIPTGADIPAITTAYVDAILAPHLKSLAYGRSKSAGRSTISNYVLNYA